MKGTPLLQLAAFLKPPSSPFPTVSLTQAYPTLAPYRPPGRLLSPSLLLSVVLNVGFALAVQVSGFLFVKQQPWYSELRSHR